VSVDIIPGRFRRPVNLFRAVAVDEFFIVGKAVENRALKGLQILPRHGFFEGWFGRL
jgi:hypothetical protein